MSDEELDKIRQYIEFKMLAEHNIGHKTEYSNVLKQEISLYNEVIRLKDVIAKTIDKLYCWGEVLDADFQREMLKILDNKGEMNK